VQQLAKSMNKRDSAMFGDILQNSSDVQRRLGELELEVRAASYDDS
jgi:hypothetical protein